MSFLRQGCVEALKRFRSSMPRRRQRRRLSRVLRYRRRGLTERGLIVPGLRKRRHAQFGEIEKSVVRLCDRARGRRTHARGTDRRARSRSPTAVFSARLLSTPILNMPQSAILGMHKIQERAVVIDGQVVVRPMMYLALLVRSPHHRRQGSRAIPRCGERVARRPVTPAAADIKNPGVSDGRFQF
jgi:pyruvate/2-oxoglutarate dehydrogenase complex dihydrolipoamide acyltransferase (E2) component